MDVQLITENLDRLFRFPLRILFYDESNRIYHILGLV